jgi:hypothetical protein
VPIVATSPEPMVTARLGQIATLSPRRLAEQPLRCLSPRPTLLLRQFLVSHFCVRACKRAVCMCVRACVYACRVCVRACVCVSVQAHMCACVRACVSVCLSVCRHQTPAPESCRWCNSRDLCEKIGGFDAESALLRRSLSAPYVDSHVISLGI